MALVPITITRSDSLKFTMNFTSDGSPVDLTGAEIRLTVRINSPKTDVTDDTEAKISSLAVITDAVGGVADFNITPSETDIDPLDYLYDIQYKDSTGFTRTINPKPLLFRVIGDITRDA